MAGSDRDALLDRAKRYSSFKYTLATVDIIYLSALILVFVAFGISKALAETLLNITPNQYIVVPLYLFAVSSFITCLASL